MNEIEWLSSLFEIEQRVLHTTPSPKSVSPFLHIQGSLPILISAPHSAVHTRNGRLKRAEGFTGAIAHLVAKITGGHALYANYRLPTDPNWDRHSPYKALLARIVKTHNIQFVFDLHGMSNWHKFGIALGTINGRSCPKETPLIEQALTTQGFYKTTERAAKNFKSLDWQTFITDHSRFTGGVSNHTITRFVTDNLGISGIQIELCTTMRIVSPETFTGYKLTQGNSVATLKTIQTIVSLINTLAT